MTQKTQSFKGARGNTRTRAWAFTINNYTESEIKDLLTQFTQAFLYIFQEEIGKNNTPHLQGTVKWKHDRSLKTMKNINGRAHWEKVRNLKSSILYCRKKDSRKKDGRRWENNIFKYIKSDKENFITKLELRKKAMLINLLQNISLKDIVQYYGL